MPAFTEITAFNADPIAFIDQHCAKLKETCNASEFKEKKEILNELDKELQKINEMIERYGESPALIKSQIKIENMRARTIIEVIKMLNA